MGFRQPTTFTETGDVYLLEPTSPVRSPHALAPVNDPTMSTESERRDWGPSLSGSKVWGTFLLRCLKGSPGGPSNTYLGQTSLDGSLPKCPPSNHLGKTPGWRSVVGVPSEKGRLRLETDSSLLRVRSP